MATFRPGEIKWFCRNSTATIAICCVLAACAQPSISRETLSYRLQTLEVAQNISPEVYRIRAGDTLGVSLSVPSLKDVGGYESVIPSQGNLLNKEYQRFIVTPEGTLRLVGLPDPVAVSGKTRADVERLITEQYKRFYNNPAVTVVLLDSKNVAYIQGEIVQPKTIVLAESGTSLADALVEGKIDRVTADLEYVYIIRPSLEQQVVPLVYQLSLTSTASYAVASQFILQAQDTILVATRPITDWSRTINQFLPTGLSNVVDPKRYD